MGWSRTILAAALAVATFGVARGASALEVCNASSGLNMRSAPSLHAPIRSVLDDGQNFGAVLGKSPNGRWTHVRVGSRSGWVYSAYTCRTGSAGAGGSGATASAAGTDHWKSPVAGYCVTSPYGHRRLNGHSDFHPGLDIGAPCGTPVHAAAPGKVIYAGRYGGYGNAVIVQHPNGLVTIYGHNTRVRVHPGQQVNQNTVISISGNTGYSFGCHVHLEVRHGLHGSTMDPRSLIGFAHCPRVGKATGFGGTMVHR